MTRPLLFIRNPDVDISMGTGGLVRSLTHERGIGYKHTPPYQCRYMKHTQVSSRPILFSARTVTPQAHTPTSLHPCHGPPRRSSTSSLLINVTTGTSLFSTPCSESVRPSVRYAEAQLQSNNPTYEQTQCQNPLRPRTVVRDATLPRTSDQIASLRTKIINTKLGVSVPIPIPIAAPIPIPIPTPQTTRASHPFNSGKPLPIPQDIPHTTQATTPRDPVRIRVVRARDRMDSGQRSSPVPFYRYPLLLFFCFCFCFLLSAFCSSIPEPRASGLRLHLRLRPDCSITETISASLRLLCPLPSARWHVLQYLQPSPAFSNKAP